MIKALEDAIEMVKALPVERQEIAAMVLREIAAPLDVGVYQPSDEDRRRVREAIAEYNRRYPYYGAAYHANDVAHKP